MATVSPQIAALFLGPQLSAPALAALLVRYGGLAAYGLTLAQTDATPWQVEQVPGGFKVLDASGQAVVYVYARETSNEAHIVGVLTFDEARRIALNVAKLPGLLGK